jgi:hypothetical protein
LWCDETYHGVYASAMACLNQEFDVGIHEWHSHCHCGTVWKDKVCVISEALDHAEDVIPTTAVKAGAVVTEFVDDLGLVLA